ncbi:glycosyltransferase [Endozoicomonas sp. GU-1]|uniref:glycosyltransferase n=1 Tax=Endozoicomonas sp. GU-1 TaxID=3009078 RepID=UPI0022B3414A|nr:glycosyltransferase [Endozoicomonas sp. GU-1]WBA81514.1 glycosyltransferase [Endozoicomonas sp. GU-1]WBA84462.1 glycosyltransferase [Endozoicomonas sp. GU-1]
MAQPLILVTMGSNGYPFQRLVDYLRNEPLYNSNDCRWYIQTGGFDIQEKPFVGTVVDLISRTEMEDLVKQSHLVISHCGIGSLNMLLQYRKRVIFVPRVAQYGEFSDDHQLQIANEIHNKKMDVVFPGDMFPTIDKNKLTSEHLYQEPIDITNYSLSKIIKKKLFETDI